MSENVLHQLQIFSEETTRLKSAYAKLLERFETVNGELSRLLHFLNTLVLDGFFFFDLEGRLLRANISAAKLFSLEWEKVQNQHFWEIFPDDHFGFSMKEALKFGISHKLLYKSFPPKEIEIATLFTYEGARSQHGLFLFCRDVTEKQKLQQTIHRNQRLIELGQMTATIAHEIRNPLGGIRGYASLLYRDLAAQKNLQEMASLIIEGTQSLEKLVSTVLQYSRPVQISFRPTEIGQFLKQVIKFVKTDPACPLHVKWSLHIPDEPLLAPIDPDALKSALLNLIFNAFQAMPQGGVMTLSLLKMDSCYQIAISDTGMGMGEEQLKRLFSPFFTTKEQGNGLGLVETQKIVQAHHGSIDVRSIVNKGTTFTLNFPLKR